MHLARFLGFPHSRHMLAALTIDEYEDWKQFSAQNGGVDFNRDDLFWSIALADFRNANRGDGDMIVQAIDFLPYHDPFAEEITAEELFAKLPGKVQP